MVENTILQDKVALVTGAGSGIGKVIATLFAENGARVIVSDQKESCREVAEMIDGVYLQADLSDMEEARDLGRKAVEIEGRVDLLVNNAGLQKVLPIDEYPDELWAQLVQIMLIAPFQLTKQVLPGMKKQKWGRIINISSIHGLVASPFKSAYISAKHGLIGLTKTVALEVGEYSITANAICPGYARTVLTENQIADTAKAREMDIDDVVQNVMLEPAAIKRLIEPEEIARLALFLASEDARSMTGAAYTIDAGWTAR